MSISTYQPQLNKFHLNQAQLDEFDTENRITRVGISKSKRGIALATIKVGLIASAALYTLHLLSKASSAIVLSTLTISPILAICTASILYVVQAIAFYYMLKKTVTFGITLFSSVKDVYVVTMESPTGETIKRKFN